MLEKVKPALRVTNNYLNPEIQGLIDAAMLDLEITGVNTASGDAIIERAVITYCKANFGYDNPEAERFERSYVLLKQHLSLSGNYNATP